MAYYFFNRCNRKSLPNLEKIFQKVGLTEDETGSTSRFWSGNVLPAKKECYKELIVSYDPASQTPLLIQTNKPQDKRKQVKKIIKSIISICRPTEIYQDPLRQLRYDLKEFEN